MDTEELTAYARAVRNSLEYTITAVELLSRAGQELAREVAVLAGKVQALEEMFGAPRA